jgi:hypothetical protein
MSPEGPLHVSKSENIRLYHQASVSGRPQTVTAAQKRTSPNCSLRPTHQPPCITLGGGLASFVQNAYFHLIN